jgi:hypothetical protein
LNISRRTKIIAAAVGAVVLIAIIANVAGGKTKTVTKTKIEYRTKINERAPAACQQAISNGRQIAGVAANVAHAMAAYPTMVIQAAKAGQAQEAAAIVSIANHMKTHTAGVQNDAAKVTVLAAGFNAAAAGCK